MGDDVRDQLAARFDVATQDKVRLWSVGGVFEELLGREVKLKVECIRRGGGELSEEDAATITEMLSIRFKAKRERETLMLRMVLEMIC